LGGLRFQQYELQRATFLLLASGWAPEKHKNGSVCKVIADASESEAGLAGVEVTSLYNQPDDFVFPSERLKGSKPLDLASVLKKKIQPAFKKIGITGVGWHTFRHTVGTMLAEMGEHQLMIRDYLRHSDLHVTNKYLQATTKSKRLAQGKLVDAILPGGVLSGSKSTLIH
jgi:integrase